MGNPNYASKGLAGSALGLAIPGTVALAGQLFNGNGLLGGLWGGNNQFARAGAFAEGQYVAQLQAEVGQLKAEKYSDNNAKEVYMQSLNDNRRLRDEMYAFIKPLSDEAANNRVELATLRAEQKCCCEKQELREQILTGKIHEVALTAKGRFDALDQTISCLAGDIRNNARALRDITDTIVPIDKVCPEPMKRYNSWTNPEQALA